MRLNLVVHVLLSISILTSCSTSDYSSQDVLGKPSTEKRTSNEFHSLFVKNSLAELSETEPHEWGEFVTGVKTTLDTNEKVMALTLDACGGPHGNQYDEDLLLYLVKENIPATLFVNARWIDEHPDQFVELANNPLFQIENHGTEHKPLSVTGKSAWGIEGTGSIDEAFEEVMLNQERIYEKTGQTPSMFRSGTAYFDEVAVKMLNEIGLDAVNYSILGDAGATYSADQVAQSLMKNAKPGAIALLHMNQPNSGTAEGIKKAVPHLIKEGYTFVRLNEYPLK